MSRISVVLTAALALGLGASARAETVAVTVDAGWYQFDVDEFTAESGGLEWISFADGSPLSFTFTTASDVLLTVVDAGFGGDMFEVFNGLASLGTTSSVPSAATLTSIVPPNFDAALAAANYSFATFLLGAGSYSITGRLAQSAIDEFGALNATVGGLRVASVVPLPASLLLLLSGSGLLGLIRRRRS
jgi:PEP-CTERM motif-containing protein